MSKYNLTDILNEYIGGGRIGTLKISYRDLVDKMDELERSGKVIVRELPGPSGDGKTNREFEVVDRDSAVAGGRKQERGFTVYDYKFGFDPGSVNNYEEEYNFSVGGNDLALAMELIDGVKPYGANEMINEGPFDVAKRKLLGLKDKILSKIDDEEIKKFKEAVKKALGKDKIGLSDITLNNAKKVADELKKVAGVNEGLISAFKDAFKGRHTGPMPDEKIEDFLVPVGGILGLAGLVKLLGPVIFFGLIGLIIAVAGTIAAVTEDSNANSNYGSNNNSNYNSNENPSPGSSYSGLQKYKNVDEIDIDSISNDPGSGDADNPEGEELEAGSGYDAVEELVKEGVVKRIETILRDRIPGTGYPVSRNDIDTYLKSLDRDIKINGFKDYENFEDDDWVEDYQYFIDDKGADARDLEEQMYTEGALDMIAARVREIKPLFAKFKYDDEILFDFVKTHMKDIEGASDNEIELEFDAFLDANYDIPSAADMMELRQHFKRFM